MASRKIEELHKKILTLKPEDKKQLLGLLFEANKNNTKKKNLKNQGKRIKHFLRCVGTWASVPEDFLDEIYAQRSLSNREVHL